MSTDIWNNLHTSYSKTNWINKPNIFAEQAVVYFPKNARILDLGAGQGQDSRFFAEQGFEVVSTDISEDAISINTEKSQEYKNMTIEQVNLYDRLPYESESFDVVYAHLSLHYFPHDITRQIFGEIYRILKKDGILACFTNSINDPEYKSGEEVEPDYFAIGDTKKRNFQKKRCARIHHDLIQYSVMN